ncbi:YdcF family protein [Shivajiella indica]|uniref:YdcF family protein n=1 Tax=Shivajiella indica TaxID=872115 RepID=A0ABW5B6S7_9BACT
MRFLAHQFLLNPGFWIFCVLIGGMVLNYKKRRWLVMPLAILAFMFFPKPIQYLVEKEERRFPIWESHQTFAPYIVVLGSGGTPDEALGPTQRLSHGSLWRVTQGVEVWKQIPESKLVFSSAGRPGYISQAEIYAEAARSWGVPDSIIRVVPTPLNTQEEARDFVVAFPEAKAVILVTSALHMPRAKKIFEKLGLKVIPALSDFRVKRHPDGERFEWIPSLEAMMMWQGYVKEKLGILLVSWDEGT